MAPSIPKISELQSIISRMPFEVCCAMVLPELGVRWREVSKAVRNARLLMTSASVARVLCRHVARSLPAEEVDDIVAKLRIKLVAIRPRTWHVIKLESRTHEEPPAVVAEALSGRVIQALRRAKARSNMRPVVQTTKLGDLMYVSVQLVSASKEGAVFYLATPPGEPVALVSSLAASTVLKACVAGLGFETYEDAGLHGRDPMSLLRIQDRAWNENAENLTEIPKYEPRPVISKNSIDFTNKTYNEDYVQQILGPNPPLLTNINFTTTKSFYDPSKLIKKCNLSVQLQSEDVAKTLKSWVSIGAIDPTSDFFHIYHKIKQNKFSYSNED